MHWTHRTIIVPAVLVDAARAACAGLAGEAGSGMFTTALSPTGEGAATHYISSGLIESPFADLLPLTTIAHTENGDVSVSLRPGDVATTMDLTTQAGLPFGVEQLQALFDGVDVSVQDAGDALTRLGLSIISTSED